VIYGNVCKIKNPLDAFGISGLRECLNLLGL